jgi:prephenate dehydrogenase
MVNPPLVKRLVILGVGLIGGSLAKAAKERGLVSEVVAWGHRQASLQKGVELGVIDRYSLDLSSAVAGADIIVIATPTQISEQMIHRLAEIGVDNSVITDVASVKGNLVAAAQSAYGAVPANMVLGHPIAGSEKSSVTAARADLFVNHRVILTPNEGTDTQALSLITALWQAVGAEVVSMSVDEHDHVLAATSHLPHVLAYALMDTLVAMEDRREIFRFAAGGLRDFTRIASSSPQMWHEIVMANKSAILASLDDFLLHLHLLKEHIASGNDEEVIEIFTRAKSARDDFAQMLARNNRNLEP